MSPQFRLATAVVTLRTLTLEDTEKVFHMSQEGDLRKWIPSQVYRDIDHAREVLAHLISQYQDGADPRTCPIVFGVENPRSGDLIGHVGLGPVRECVEIGFAIEDSQKRQGYATAAVKEMCRWAMNEYPIGKIHAFVAKGNEASQRVLLRAGFARVGEETMRFQGSVEPVAIFELVRTQGNREAGVTGGGRVIRDIAAQ